jgi:hypothetical protein
MSRCAFGCGEIGDLWFLCCQSPTLDMPCSLLPDYSIRHALVKGSFTNRSVCTKCASCCGAFRSWKFPSLRRWLVMLFRVEIRRSERTHFGLGTTKGIVSTSNLKLRLRAPSDVHTSWPCWVVEFVVDSSKYGGAFSKIHVGGRSLA